RFRSTTATDCSSRSIESRLARNSCVSCGVRAWLYSGAAAKREARTKERVRIEGLVEGEASIIRMVQGGDYVGPVMHLATSLCGWDFPRTRRILRASHPPGGHHVSQNAGGHRDCCR